MNLRKMISICSALATAASAMAAVQSGVSAEVYEASSVDAATGAITVDSSEKIINRSTSGTAENNMVEHDLGNGFKVVLGKGGSTSDDSKCDYVDGTTVYFRASSDWEKNAEGTANLVGDNSPINRYLEFTPSVSGTLSVTCSSGGSNRWGIVKKGDDTATASTGVNKSDYYCLTSANSWTTVSTQTRELTAGTTYGIFGKGGSHTFTDVVFTPDAYVAVEKLTADAAVTGEDESVSDVFYGTFTKNSDTAFSRINITVGEETKTLETASLSGGGEVCLGVVITYLDGVSKNYTPGFTFE